MSRRTSESNKAIRAAWNNEQQLIKEGKATREWTPAQQQDILDKGKAYDKDGRAFEGQHMMSAEKYPEYQGNPENIQFLTRDEHLEAHDGNWQNPTNWYFNPTTKEKTDFSNGKFKPCEIIDLCDSVVSPQGKPVVEKEVPQELMAETSKKISQEKISKEVPKGNSNIGTKSKVGFGQRIQNVLISGFEKVVEFKVEHPGAIKAVKSVVVAVSAAVIYEAIKKNPSNSEYERLDADCNEYEASDNVDYSIAEDNSHLIERSSPGEHSVRSHGQHYNTKEGRIWKEKDSYSRGGENVDK